MKANELTIDPEFRDLLPPLSPMQKAELEALLEDEGCREPIKVWANHDDTIIDGHHRHEICTRLGIKFKVEAVNLATREDVLKWIFRHQAGRRNLSDKELSYIRGRIYETKKKSKAEAGSKGGRSSKGQSDPCLETTAEQVARDFDVSDSTIKRDARFARQVDNEVAKEPPENRAAKKAELLGRNGKHKPATAKASDNAVSWTTALAKASKKKCVTKDDVAKMLNKKDSSECRRVLSALVESRGYVVTTYGKSGAYTVRKSITLPVDEVESDANLLAEIKRRALVAHEEFRDKSNFGFRWDISMELISDLLRMLEHIK